METQNDKSELYKVCILGDIGVGKTALRKRLCHDTFDIAYKATIGVEFGLKIVNDTVEKRNMDKNNSSTFSFSHFFDNYIY